MNTSVLSVALLSVTLGMALVQSVSAQPYDIPVKPLYQNDYADKIDNSKYSIADYGCTLTAWTMAINHGMETTGLHKKNADGSAGSVLSYTPAELNKLLNDYRYEEKTYKKDEKGKYVREDGKLVVEKTKKFNGWGVEVDKDDKPTGSTTDLNLGSMLEAVEKDTQKKSHEGKGLKQSKYRGPGWGGTPEIDPKGVKLDENYLYILDELAAGRPVPARVAKDTHTVLITSFHQEEGKPRGVGRYDIKDPFRKKNGTAIEWLDDKEYGNLIYDWGISVFQAGGEHEPFEVPGEFYVDPLLLHDLQANPDQFGPQVFQENHAIPEPSTLALFGMGLAGWIGTRRRRVS